MIEDEWIAKITNLRNVQHKQWKQIAAAMGISRGHLLKIVKHLRETGVMFASLVVSKTEHGEMTRERHKTDTRMIEALRRHNEGRKIVFNDDLRAALFRLRNGQQLGWLDISEIMGISTGRIRQEVCQLRKDGHIILRRVPKKDM